MQKKSSHQINDDWIKIAGNEEATSYEVKVRYIFKAKVS